MFWNKKPLAPKAKIAMPKISKADQALIKPSTRREQPREKRIDISLTCYLYVEATGYLLETTTINVSKTGILCKALGPMETGQEVLVAVTNKKNFTKLNVLHGKNTMKGKVVRVEKDGIIYRIAVQITLGSVDPFACLGDHFGDQFWWSRSWK